MGDQMIEKAYILPTGGEILDGTVLDTDSPMIMGELLRMNPGLMITRLPPIDDDKKAIAGCIQSLADSGADLIVLVGGSGGGHRHSPTLGFDFTHTAIENLLENPYFTSLYGKNGHMWCRLACGFLGKALLINLPGPFIEAQAAIRAFVLALKDHGFSPGSINEYMAHAVRDTYPAT